MTKEEAIERVRKRNMSWCTDDEDKDALAILIPELAESEDEKIRKAIRLVLIATEEDQELFYRTHNLTRKECTDWLEKQKEPVVEGRGLYYYDGEKFTYCGYPATEDNPYDFAMNQQEKPKTATATLDSEKQKEQNDNEGDFTIYHPLKNGKGEYECIPYSFYGSLTSFSEDKDLIDFLRTCFCTKEECKEWIERQKEQKPASGNSENPNNQWSEEDETYLQDALWCVEKAEKVAKDENDMGACWCARRLLKSLPERFNPQPKQEWSEEDESTRHDIIATLESLDVTQSFVKAVLQKEISRLKSLRPQSKPEWSEEDKRALNNAIVALSMYANGEIPYLLPSQLLEDVERLKSLRPQPNRNLAVSFMDYLDEHRPEGKMCLSNGECADIETAFKENDWAKVIRYVNKYHQPHWKPSEEQMKALEGAQLLYEHGLEREDISAVLKSLYNSLKKLL